MSEIATTATTATAAPAVDSSAPSAPQTTTDIAASVVHAAEAEDSGETAQTYAAPDDTTRAAATGTTTEAPPLTIEELSEAAKFLQSQGHKAKTADGREVWFPFKSVERFLDRYVTQHKGTWDGARSELEKDRDTLRGHLADLHRGVTGDPRAFLTELAGADPRYQAFLEPPKAETPVVDARMPEPDLALSDGSRTYSLDGIQKLLDWKTAQVEAKIDAKLGERDKKSESERQRQETVATLREETRRQMTEAQQWPMFGPLAADNALTPFQTEVLSELRKDTERAQTERRRPTMTMRQAYLEVYARHQEPDKIRERLMKELNEAPKGTAVARTGVEPTRAHTGRTTADIVRQVVAQAEAGR